MEEVCSMVMRKFLAGAAIAPIILFSGAVNAAPLYSGKMAASTELQVMAVSDNAGLDEEAAAGARNFVDNMGKRAIGFLSDAALSQEERRMAFRGLLEDSFDMKTIGRFALGTYWRTADPGQKQTYLQLFNDMIVNVYSRRFEEYDGQNFDIKGYSTKGRRDVLVNSYIIPQGDPKVRVDWLVRYKDGRYRIVDVIVEGVSMSITQRSDFSSIIQRGGGRIDVLLDHLKAQTGAK
jgi:phospholipid transport system substrate-binding protein